VYTRRAAFYVGHLICQVKNSRLAQFVLYLPLFLGGQGARSLERAPRRQSALHDADVRGNNVKHGYQIQGPLCRR
jgi:hypothetical protein